MSSQPPATAKGQAPTTPKANSSDRLKDGVRCVAIVLYIQHHTEVTMQRIHARLVHDYDW